MTVRVSLSCCFNVDYVKPPRIVIPAGRNPNAATKTYPHNTNYLKALNLPLQILINNIPVKMAMVPVIAMRKA